MTPADTFDRGERLMSFGFQVFALNGYGLPWKNCPSCPAGCSPEHMAACACLTCHGFYRATDDIDVLAAQLQRHPWSILGVRTGLASRLLVLDFDVHPGQADGLALYAELLQQQRLEPTPMVRTGGGGIHRYYRLEESCRTLAGFRPGLDVKADGGYVVAPGFAKTDRPAYCEDPFYGFDDLSLAPAPAWVLEELLGPAKVGVLTRRVDPFQRTTRDPVAAFDRALARLAEGKVGGRNTGVFVCGCKARIVADRGLGDLAEMSARVRTVALRVGLTDAQFAKQWSSGAAVISSPVRPTPLVRK